jgi:hypothetical protein
MPSQGKPCGVIHTLLPAAFRAPVAAGICFHVEEAERIRTLLDACKDVLKHLEGRDDPLALQIQRTCHDLESRLAELSDDSAAATG